MLYTLLTDSNVYLDPLIDMEQIDRLVGEVSDETIELHIELNNAPRSFKNVFNEPLIENEGEFIPAIYENGEAFIFTPLRVAEDVEGVDTTLTRHNSWGDLENLVIREDKVKDWSVFRTKIENYRGLHAYTAKKRSKRLLKKSSYEGCISLPI